MTLLMKHFLSICTLTLLNHSTSFLIPTYTKIPTSCWSEVMQRQKLDGTDVTGDLKLLLQQAKNDNQLIKPSSEKVKQMLAGKQIRTTREAMTAISLLKLSGNLEGAVSVLSYMVENSIPVDAYIFNNLIDGCARIRNWGLGLELLDKMCSLNISPDTITFSSAISACEKSGKWELALELLERMTKLGIKRDTICFSTVISACARKGQWKQTLRLLKRMCEEQVPLDSITLNSAMSAAAKDGNIEAVSKLLNIMTVGGFKKDIYTYTTSISACEHDGKWEYALELLQDMLKELGEAGQTNLEPAPFNAAISVCIR